MTRIHSQIFLLPDFLPEVFVSTYRNFYNVREKKHCFQISEEKKEDKSRVRGKMLWKSGATNPVVGSRNSLYSP